MAWKRAKNGLRWAILTSAQTLSNLKKSTLTTPRNGPNKLFFTLCSYKKLFSFSSLPLSLPSHSYKHETLSSIPLSKHPFHHSLTVIIINNLYDGVLATSCVIKRRREHFLHLITKRFLLYMKMCTQCCMFRSEIRRGLTTTTYGQQKPIKLLNKNYSRLNLPRIPFPNISSL